MFKFLFGFRGRISVSSFMLYRWWVCPFLVTFPLFILIGMIGFEPGSDETWQKAALIMIGGLSLASQAARRFHDVGKSGWWVVWYFVLPAICMYAGHNYLPPIPNDAVSLVGVGFWIFGVFELFFCSGEVETNRYGTRPLWA